MRSIAFWGAQKFPLIHVCIVFVLAKTFLGAGLKILITQIFADERGTKRHLAAHSTCQMDIERQRQRERKSEKKREFVLHGVNKWAGGGGEEERPLTTPTNPMDTQYCCQSQSPARMAVTVTPSFWPRRWHTFWQHQRQQQATDKLTKTAHTHAHTLK